MRRLEHKEEVERLMQRFIDGISTLEEEAQLAEFFRTHEVTGKWCAYKEVFALFDEGKVELPFSTEEKPEAMSGKKRRWGKYAGIAAAVILLIAVGAILRHQMSEKPELVAQADTTKTTPSPMPQKVEEHKEKADTMNRGKEMQRLSRPPKRYMARQVRRPEVVMAEMEEASEPDITERVPDDPSVQHVTLPIDVDYEALRKEIQERGKRMEEKTDLMAINYEEEDE